MVYQLVLPLLAAASIGFALPPFGSRPPDGRMVCGINALYVYLVMHGHDVDYDEVRRSLDTDEIGHSILQLSQQAGRFGANSKVVHCDLRAIEEKHLPAIVFLPPPGESTIGHYILLTQINGDRCEYIDGTTSQLQRDIPLNWLQRISRGCCVVPAGAEPSFSFAETAWLQLVGICSMVGVSYLIVRGFRSVSTGKHGVLCGVAALTLAGTCCAYGVALDDSNELLPNLSEITPSIAGDFCRREEFAAANVAYVILRSQGNNVDYSEIWSTIYGSSVGEVGITKIRDVYDSYGVEARILRIRDIRQLAQNVPCVTLYRPHRASNDTFGILVAADDAYVTLVHGGHVVPENMRMETFTRAWSGIVLSHRSDGASDQMAWFVAECAVAFILTGLAAGALRKALHRGDMLLSDIRTNDIGVLPQ